MAKGNPNNKTSSFVAKIRNANGEYEPIYRLPDATSTVKGGVWLSDATNGSDDAATGVVAATPKAVADVYTATTTKLDKATTDDQTVTGKVTFSSEVTASKGITGDLAGNASSADKWKNERKITVAVGSKSASQSVDGSKDVEIKINAVSANDLEYPKGFKFEREYMPEGVLEKLVVVKDQDARYALTTDNVQNGDTVLQEDTKVMWYVYDESNLNNEDGYREYAAGTATKAISAESAGKATQDSAGQQINTTYIKGLSVSGKTITYTKGNGTTGTITTQDTTYSDMKGATADAAGAHGLVPAPAKGANTKFLRGDGQWVDAAIAGTVGSGTVPVYFENGVAKASTSTVGSSTKPVYLNNGTITASTSTIGSSTKPVYLNSGAVTASSSTVGGAAKPVYLNNGTFTACSSTVGSGVKPVYLNSGTVTASGSTVGSTTQPVYLNAGTITATAYTLGASVPAIPSTTGVVYLSNKGWQTVQSGVTSVNGATGAITGVVQNTLATKTYDDSTTVSAYQLKLGNGADVTNYIRATANGILPSDASGATNNIGSTKESFNNVYATTFHGHLDGSAESANSANTATTANSATTATKLSRNLTLTGAVTSTKISFNTTSDITTTLTLASNSVDKTNIKNGAITQEKLADDIGTVYVGSDEPSAESVKLWIKI